MQRHDVTDREWARLQPHLPLQRPRTGRPAKDHRLILNALLWLAKTGAPWRDLPERFGPWQTVATRFYRWTRSGLWDRILAELRSIADARGGIDWEVHMIDGTNVRAHRCATGANVWPAPSASSFCDLNRSVCINVSGLRGEPWPRWSFARPEPDKGVGIKCHFAP
jgi:transposase